MDSSEFRSLLSFGVSPINEHVPAGADEAGSDDVEEDGFIADVVNSLASVQEDPAIMEYISLLAAESESGDPLTLNNNAIPAASASATAAATFSSRDWAKHRGELETLYSEKDLKLKEIMKIMRDKYNLSAGDTQFRRQFAKWGLEKNVKFNEMRKIIQIWMRRQQQGKNTEFLVRNRPVSAAKIDRFRRRNGAVITESSPAWQTPAQIVYFTPELLLKTSMTSSTGVDSSSISASAISASADASDHTLDLFATYMRANFQPANGATANSQTYEVTDSRGMPSLASQAFPLERPAFRKPSPGPLSFHPLHHKIQPPRMHDGPDADAYWVSNQTQHWQTPDKSNLGWTTTTDLYRARTVLAQPLIPSYQLVTRWTQDPDLQQLIISMEGHLLRPQQENAIPEEHHVTALLQKAIMKDDRGTILLVLHYQRKDDFASRCPMQLLQVAQNYQRYELFAILIMHGLTKEGDSEQKIDLARLKQAQVYLQYGYPFLSNSPQHSYFFFFLHRTNIANDVAITSWTADALLNGDSRILALLSQYRQRCSLPFILEKAPLLYSTMQTSPETYTLVHDFLVAGKNEAFKQPWHQLFLATALLQHEAVQRIVGNGTGAQCTTGMGQTALHFLSTIDYGDGTDVLATLLSHGVQVDAADCSGNTCLHTAFQSRWSPWKQQFITSLVQCGANINAQNLYGQTCLGIVAAHWRLDEVDEMAALLANLGADWTIRNRQGQTPEQILMLRKCI